ncbi:MAG: hypothetical protein B7Z67_11415 [Acidiphilium sp. 21-60-14]|nr:MAG: hypothetical protein B7Z67_11415 [Acidiphilium sp. 21-60-14]OYW12657.1 MAG: hypothetical protein B7Z59_00515 [Acidiphilium sp. 37-67-22]
MEQVTNPLALCLADRFTAIAHMLRKTLGAPDYARFDLSLKWAIWHRISLLSRRFRSLSLNPRPIRERKPGAKAQTKPESAQAPTSPTGAKRREIPGQNGWLLQTFPGHHIPYVRGHLIRFLEDPDLSLLHAANPRIGRVLRPICHMLAIPLPAYLKLPRKPRKPEQKPARKPARRSEKPEPSFYEYMLAKYPPAPPRPTLPGHIYAPPARAKINFER